MAKKTQRTRRPFEYLNIESAAVMRFLALTLLGLAAVSFTMSYSGLVAVAPWAGLPAVLYWTVPVMIDSGIVIFGLAVFVMRARSQLGALLYAWGLFALFTSLSIAANVMHALDATSGDEFHRRVTGAVIAGTAPFLVATASHMLTLTVIEPAEKLVETTKAVKARVSAPAPNPTPPGAAVTARPSSPAAVTVATQAPPARVAGVSVSQVDERIRAALRAGSVPTGRDVGDWLGGKSPRTGQRHLATLASRDATVAAAMERLNSSVSEPVPGPWAATA